MKKNSLAVIDSGSGGLSIWQSIVALLPHESIIYVGDHAHLPYSEKTTVYIRERIIKIIKFLSEQKVKLVVIACNTATVAGIEDYRKHFPGLPIIGVVPVIKTAAEVSKRRSLAVLSTKYTAASQYQRDLIEKFARDCQVINLGCSDLVTAVENGNISGKEIKRKLEEILAPLKKTNVDCLVLGCTHYAFLTNVIRDIVGNDVLFLDSGGAVARHVRRVLDSNKVMVAKGRPGYWFLTTGDARKVTRVAGKLLQRKVGFKKINL